MTGHYRMHRGWQDHAIFRGQSYCERAAFEWLIGHAAWKNTRARVGSKMVAVHRGQLHVSLRYLAVAWGWHRNRVQRFLRMLTKERMIGTESGTGQTFITICNYDRYQASRDNLGTEPGTILGQERDSNGTKNNKEEEGKEEDSPPSPPAGTTAQVMDLEFEVFWREAPRKIGKGQAQRAYKTARKTADAETLLAAIKRFAELRRGQEERFTKHPATWLNGECWLDETPPEPPKRWTIGIG